MAGEAKLNIYDKHKVVKLEIKVTLNRRGINYNIFLNQT